MRHAPVALFLALFAAPALAHEGIRVKVDVLKVRAGPGYDRAVKGHVYRDQVYVKVDEHGRWMKIWYGHETGWVNSDGIAGARPDNAIALITGHARTARRGPGGDYDSVGTAPVGSWWAVVGVHGAWRKVCFRGSERWIYGLSKAGGPHLPTSEAGFVQLPAAAPGFYSSAVESRRWGLPRLIYGIMNGCATWRVRHPRRPRIGVGEISLRNGGDISGHVSHERGVDADIRPVAKTGYEGALTITSSIYSSFRTKDYITRHLRPWLDIDVIFFNDPKCTPLPYVAPLEGHHNHMHVRIY